MPREEGRQKQMLSGVNRSRFTWVVLKGRTRGAAVDAARRGGPRGQGGAAQRTTLTVALYRSAARGRENEGKVSKPSEVASELAGAMAFPPSEREVRIARGPLGHGRNSARSSMGLARPRLARQRCSLRQEMWDKIELLMIHCEEGNFRGPAVAAAISRIRFGFRQDFEEVLNRSWACRMAPRNKKPAPLGRASRYGFVSVRGGTPTSVTCCPCFLSSQR